ncbi:hypothetical protein [Vibrio sp. VPAP30]|uniref:hypothetical protein n=1 Tax=Vibrio sp. VPAP30 TaxID=1647102 RepID=UPI000658A3FB|nr:hypothetical protein [Vibrio sp. VPAP30]KLN63626.1 hypothetical protein ZX61_19085 [Vibrio sp. VPAP30]
MPNAIKEKLFPEGKIFYQAHSMHAHPSAGLMVQQPVPLSFIKMSRYDASVSDIVMTGPLAKIIESLHAISLRSESIYTTDKHKTIKVWFNRIDRKIEKTPMYPMAEAMIHNTSFLIIKGTGVGLGSTVVDLLQGVGVNDVSFRLGLDSIFSGELKDSPLKDIMLEMSVFELLSQPIDLLFKKVWTKHLKSKHSSPLKSDPQGKAAFLKLKSLVEKHIKPLVKPHHLDVGVDMNISSIPYSMPKGWKNTNLAPLFSRVKARASLLTADDYIIRVGSSFNKHHAGFVVDLDTHNIEIDELVYFLSYYEENKKLVNCFLMSGLDDL